MKAPLRASNSTIEKLRVWLAAELESLEICNNAQYAHHVVTIFLNDADVEDEPLSPSNDLVKELETLRAGKSLDQKKRAAVQFLKGIIPMENQPIQCFVEQLIEELVDRVDATRIRTPKKPAVQINLNVEAARRVMNIKSDHQSFEEAFPSLPAESKSVTVTVRKGACADGWLKKSGEPRKKRAARRITFVDKTEDAVCVKTGLLHLISIPDKMSSPVTIQVDESSLETGIFSGSSLRHNYEPEWKSAFIRLVPNSPLYIPKKIRLPLPLEMSSPARPTSWRRVTVLSGTYLNHLADSYLSEEVDLKSRFLPIETKAPAMPPNPFFALDADDIEVSNTVSWEKANNRDWWRRQNNMVIEKDEAQISHAEDRVEVNHMEAEVEVGHVEGEVDVGHLVDEIEVGHMGAEVDVEAELDDNEMEVEVSVNHTENRKDGDGRNSGMDDRLRSVGPSSPLLGAVGGADEVKTDDLVGFAMSQMARLEMERSGFFKPYDYEVPEQNRFGFPLGLDQGGHGGTEGRGSEVNPGGGEDNLHKMNLLEWVDGVKSPSGWLESASVWRIAALGQWRKTPGRRMYSEEGSLLLGAEDIPVPPSNRNEELRAGATAPVEEPRENWDSWKDPVDVPGGSSWDSVLLKDVYSIPSPPIPTLEEEKERPTTNPNDFFRPAALYRMADDNVSHKLESAFVDSLFSARLYFGPGVRSPITIRNCSALEQMWLAHRSDSEDQASIERCDDSVVRGRTCVNWLEGVCHRGIHCPFSHPSI